MKELYGVLMGQEERRMLLKEKMELERRQYEEAKEVERRRHAEQERAREQEQEAKRQRCNAIENTMVIQAARSWSAKIQDPDLDAEAAMEIHALLYKYYLKQKDLK